MSFCLKAALFVVIWHMLFKTCLLTHHYHMHYLNLNESITVHLYFIIMGLVVTFLFSVAYSSS